MRFVYHDREKHALSHQILVAFGGIVKGPLTAIIGIILIVNGFLFIQLVYPSFWSMTVGFPLVFLGVSIFVIGVWGFFASIFSFGYSISHCPFCSTPVTVKDKVWGELQSCPNCKKKFKPDKKI